MQTIKTFDKAIVVILSKREMKRIGELLQIAVKDSTSRHIAEKLANELQMHDLNPKEFCIPDLEEYFSKRS